MYVVRPVAISDIPTLEAMWAGATPGVHSLPRTRKTIELAVERSVASFAARPDTPLEESYFFVLESTVDRSIAGTAGISATAGASGVFFAFRNEVLSQVSRELNISYNVNVLMLCSDLTSYSQLSGFFMRDRSTVERPVDEAAALLSRSRLMYAALAPQRFSEKFFASIAGTTDENGRSAFWEALGRKFFQMDFLEVEHMIEGARNRTLIAELMPHYPVYVPLLPEDAQEALARVNGAAELPFHILSNEGFELDEYIDIFDGGPILRAPRNALCSFSQSLERMVVDASSSETESIETWLVATVREEHFRSMLVQCPSPELSEDIALPEQAMRCLDVARGDTVLCVRL
ncbi:MAG TPA: arginine N-succinyltransferase [Noviherbaspirillum sp.]|nr:arginine N-succinyltransferase [Noviherbaspirillum sp.]